MKKISLKAGAALLVAGTLIFGQAALAQEGQSKTKVTPEKTKTDDTKMKNDKDEHDHSTVGAPINGVATGVKTTGKSVGKGVGKAGKSVGKAASKVTEPVH